MTGKIDRHSLIPELPISHSGAVFVLSKQKPGKKVIAGVLPGSPRRDEALYPSVQLRDCALQTAIRRRWHPKRHFEYAAKSLVHKVKCKLQRVAELLTVARIVEVKQRLQGDLAGHGFKFIIDLHRFAVRPGCEHLLGLLRHDRGIGGHASLEEHGLNELALATPKNTFACNKSIAKHRPDARAPKCLM